MMMPPPQLQSPPGLRTPPSRADARRNFDRLIAAAEAVFAEHGTDAPLDEIAQRAGVGSGTLYRHFANREELLTTVFWERIRAVCAEGEALRKIDPPLLALVTWLRKLMGLTMQRGLADALMSQTSESSGRLFQACHAALSGTAETLLDLAKGSGEVSEDVVLDDVLHLCHAIASYAQTSPDPMPQVDRMMGLLVNGMRTRGGPLPDLGLGGP